MKKYLLSLFICCTFFSAASVNVDCLQDLLLVDRAVFRTVFSDINSHTSLQEMREIYAGMKIVLDKSLVKNIAAQRLINQEDWEIFNFEMGPDTWKAYGEDTIQAWFEARDYTLYLSPDRSLDSSLLKEFHWVTTRNHKFHGFEGRRIRQRYLAGEISKEQMKDLLNRAFKNNEEVSQIPHESLRGKYRYEDVDQIVHSGSSFTPEGNRYFTKHELEELRKNKYITVDESTIKKIGEDVYTGTAYYMDVHLVEESVEEILRETEQRLAEAVTPQQVLSAVVIMSRDLISVHPFLDGNGRSIRLLGDYILRKYLLPPSLYPNESDLTMSVEEAVQFHIDGMKDYLREHQSFRRNRLKNKLLTGGPQ